jgi:hypothetical protein
VEPVGFPLLPFEAFLPLFQLVRCGNLMGSSCKWPHGGFSTGRVSAWLPSCAALGTTSPLTTTFGFPPPFSRSVFRPLICANQTGDHRGRCVGVTSWASNGRRAHLVGGTSPGSATSACGSVLCQVPCARVFSASCRSCSPTREPAPRIQPPESFCRVRGVSFLFVKCDCVQTNNRDSRDPNQAHPLRPLDGERGKGALDFATRHQVCLRCVQHDEDGDALL